MLLEKEVYIKDVIAFKESCKIAIEVTYCDLNNTQIECIKEAITRIETSRYHKLAKIEAENLLLCLNIFKTSKTWHWLKEDFKKAVNDFLFSLNKSFN